MSLKAHMNDFRELCTDLNMVWIHRILVLVILVCMFSLPVGCEQKKEGAPGKGYRPVIRSSSQSNDSYSARHILEESNVVWHSASYPTYPQWVEFVYKSPVIIIQLTMLCQPGGSRRAPLEFYFQGEDTGGQWVNLLAVSNASFSQGNELKSWIVENSTAFKRYRIYITKNAGAPDFVTIAKVGFNYGSAPKK